MALVIYKSLDFLGYEKYKVGNDGSFWSNSHITEEQAIDIRNKYATGNFSYVDLGKEYNVDGSTIGNVIKGRFYIGWKKLKPYKRKDNYLQISFSKDGIETTFLAHVIVLTAFSGPKPLDSLQCCHNDGNKTNNKIENLRWDTPKGNSGDRIKHNTHNKGDRHGIAKLNDLKVLEIRALYKTGCFTCTELGIAFNISRGTIWCVIKRITWTHI